MEPTQRSGNGAYLQHKDVLKKHWKYEEQQLLEAIEGSSFRPDYSHTASMYSSNGFAAAPNSPSSMQATAGPSQGEIDAEVAKQRGEVEQYKALLGREAAKRRSRLGKV